MTKRRNTAIITAEIVLLIMLVIAAFFLGRNTAMKKGDGKSAYDLAVESGYNGTVEQWLASLAGETGANGVDGANAYCTSLENVTIPDSVKIISGSCFRACKDIKEIRLPEELKMIKEIGFWECDGLVTVYIPKNIVVDDDAFLGCHDTVFYVYADEIPAGWGKSWEQADFSAKTIKEAP